VLQTIQRTISYLDPIYYNTDKSDVFSFGVVLVELLTRRKPCLYHSDNGDDLVTHFTSLLIEGRPDDIIDPHIMEEEDGEIL
jgi:serine/threonine protein kinase